MPEMGRLAILDAVRPAYHLYVVILRIEELSRSRDEILDALQNSLPLYPAMTDGDVADTIAAVTKVITHSAR